MEKKPELILVIPAHNEEEHIGDVINEARKHIQKIIIVDDCSKDNTGAIAKNAGAIVLRHRANLGKADALKTGCEAAIKLGADVIIIMDGDGQHKPEDLPLLTEAISDGCTDIVFGVRKESKHVPFVRLWGTRVTDLLMTSLFKIKISDIQCGYRAFTREAYEKLKWRSRSYLADAEMTARTGRFKLRYKEVTIQTVYYDEYKGMTIIDGLQVLLNIIIWRIIL